MIEILIVEGDDIISEAISKVIDTDPDMHVIGIAKDGFDAMRMIADYAPDVVLLNLSLRGLDGIDVIKGLERIDPVPVVLISQLDDEHSVKLTDSWFEKTVVEFILRPDNPKEVMAISGEILMKVRSASVAHLRKILPDKRLEMRKTSTKDKIIVIASSTGGPLAVSFILSSLPKEVPCPILIVQHLPPKFSQSFAERLRSTSGVRVKEATDGDLLENGVAYIAPGDYHMELLETKKGVAISLNQKSKSLGVRPCADVTMRTASVIYKDATIGVVLTGMGHDGTIGSKFIKRQLGTVIIESKKTCVVNGMPGSVFKSGYFDLMLDLEQIPVAIVQILEQ